MNFSLIIPAFNEEKYIYQTLQSVMSHKDKLLEVIVVDNASTDNTKSVAESFAGVRVVGEPIKGLTRARQRGLEESKGDVLIYLDADTELSAQWLNKVIQKYNSDPQVVSVTGRYVFKDVSNFTNAFVFVYWVIGYIMYLFSGYLVVGGNFAARKSALLRIGGFDKTIEFYGEDTDIARRLHKVGKVVFLLSAKVYTSPRRLQGDGLMKTVWLYVKNFFSVIIGGKPATATYNDLR